MIDMSCVYVVDTTKFDITNKPKIGEGAYGTVYLDTDATDKAVKIFKDNVDGFSDFDPCIFREIDVSIKMGEAGFSPKVEKIFCDNDIGYSMELYSCSLHDIFESKHAHVLDYNIVLKNLDSMIFQITLALAYAQQHKLLHRDVKPENILVDTQYVEENIELPGYCGYKTCLADWGLASRRINNSLCNNDRIVQTMWYRCPEHLLKMQEYMNNQTIDMWSIGIIMLEILWHKNGIVSENDEKNALNRIVNLFGMPNDELMMRYMSSKKITSHDNNNYIETICENANASNFCKSFIRQCLQLSPLTRLTPIDGLKHPFLYHFIENLPINKFAKTLKISYTGDPFLELANIDSYDGVNIEKILNKNYGYIAHYYRDTFLKFYNSLTASLQIYSMCVCYTDKIMEMIEFKSLIVSTFDINLALAIYALVYGSLVDSEPDKKILTHISKTNPHLKITNTLIIAYMKLILKTFKYNLPIKTFVTYQELIPKTNVGIKELYRECCKKVITDGYNFGLTAEQTFGKLLEVINKYQYKKENTTVMFKEQMYIVNNIIKIHESLLHTSAQTFEFSKTIAFNGGIISLHLS